MSDFYRRKLVLIQTEFDAAREAIDYVRQNWQRQNIVTAIRGSGPEDFRRAADSLETVFFIRLFSLFEGILKENLDQHHASLSVPEDARAVWMIDRVSQRQSPPIPGLLRLRVQAIRRHRNFLVHARGIPPPGFSFAEALAALSRFVNRLPEPR